MKYVSILFFAFLVVTLNAQGVKSNERDPHAPMQQQRPFFRQPAPDDSNAAGKPGGRDMESGRDSLENLFENLRQNDPEAFRMVNEIRNLEREARRAIREYIQIGSKEDKSKLKMNALEMLGNATRMRVELAHRKLAELEERIAALRETLDIQGRDVEQAAAARFENMVRETEPDLKR